MFECDGSILRINNSIIFHILFSPLFFSFPFFSLEYDIGFFFFTTQLQF